MLVESAATSRGSKCFLVGALGMAVLGTEATRKDYGKAVAELRRRNEWEDVLWLLGEMENSVGWDVITLSTAVSAMGVRWGKALALLLNAKAMRMERHESSKPFFFLRKNSCLKEKIKTKMKSNEIICNSRFREASQEVNSVTYHAALNACERANEWAQALSLLGRSEHMELESIKGYGSCIQAVAWVRALGLLKRQRQRVQSSVIVRLGT